MMGFILYAELVDYPPFPHTAMWIDVPVGADGMPIAGMRQQPRVPDGTLYVRLTGAPNRGLCDGYDPSTDGRARMAAHIGQ